MTEIKNDEKITRAVYGETKRTFYELIKMENGCNKISGPITGLHRLIDESGWVQFIDEEPRVLLNNDEVVELIGFPFIQKR